MNENEETLISTNSTSSSNTVPAKPNVLALGVASEGFFHSFTEKGTTKIQTNQGASLESQNLTL
jgi:hypothetical protein